jgi:integrase
VSGRELLSTTAQGNWRNRAWRECAPAANVPYDLRHGYSLSLALEGVPDREAARRMGHSPATHVYHYADMLDGLSDRKREPMAAAVKKCRKSAASAAIRRNTPAVALAA